MRNLKLTALGALACILLAGCAEKDDIERKVDELLSKMTLREKIGQMHQVSGGADLAEAAANGEIGSILNCVDPDQINAVQRAAVEQSRLGIPVIVGRDVIHGFRTIFPIPLGLAATFDPELVEQGARVAAVEATASGVRWTFSPMLDIARDPRWGRVAEGSGEDPYLDTQMGVAMVRGYQGDDLADASSMAACIKHFVGYGAVEGGRDYNSTMISERSLRNTYFPAFKACVDAGALTLMTSFNEIDGIPSTGNDFLLRDVLRKEWGFDGMVVTDWNSSGEMIAHGFAKDLKQATEQSVNAGVDMDMMSFGFINFIEELVAEGKIKETTIDDAVRNILRLKFRLGLFDNPYVDASKTRAAAYTPESLEAARRSAAESAILLKNDGGVLPLDDVRTILVTGPMADAPYDQLGTWAFDGEPEHTVTPLAALRERYDVIYEPGLAYSRDRNTADLAKVRAAAARAEAVVAFVGEEAILSGEAHSLSAHRASLSPRRPRAASPLWWWSWPAGRSLSSAIWPTATRCSTRSTLEPWAARRWPISSRARSRRRARRLSRSCAMPVRLRSTTTITTRDVRATARRRCSKIYRCRQDRHRSDVRRTISTRVTARCSRSATVCRTRPSSTRVSRSTARHSPRTVCSAWSSI